MDGLGDGVALQCASEDLDFMRTTSFGLLQARRALLVVAVPASAEAVTGVLLCKPLFHMNDAGIAGGSARFLECLKIIHEGLPEHGCLSKVHAHQIHDTRVHRMSTKRLVAEVQG